MVNPAKKIVVIGGGTGNFVVLSGLKKYDVDISAVVSMADDGGSTGILRDELGVLPPGDVRQCLVALSESSDLMRDLMNYRFENGGLKGHSFGNIFLSALEKVTGSFEQAVEEVGRILSIKGKVIPATTNQVRLRMVLNDGTLLNGEGEIYTSDKLDQGYKSIYLEPKPRVDSHAVEEIMNADAVVMAPGGLYTSLIPVLLVDQICKALLRTKAKKILVLNLMNRNGQTTGFKTSDYVREITKFTDEDIFDFILVNTASPSASVLKKYAAEKELVVDDLNGDKRIIRADLLSKTVNERKANDVLAAQRALIRHDPDKVAKQVMDIVGR
ncbi:YvcK family protein [Candidatus Woesearchaeota archaeon]|nr:YvcK family protein [Candidatus Woesearchaeota archaeon]